MAQTRAQGGLAAQALMDLRGLILNGELAPGERLYEVALSERLAVSRTPLRSALAALEQEGLAERLETGGYAVRSFTLADVTDAIELRGVLEGTAARLAAERGAEPGEMARFAAVLDALDGLFGPGAEDMDFDGYVTLNAEFHAILARLCGSETIRREVARVARLPLASANAFLRAQNDVPAFRRSLIGAQAQHHALFDAIAAREGARAEAIAREHARLARRNLEYVLHEDRRLIRRVPGLVLVAPAGEA